MKNSLTRNGFTLVELIVVVSILAILAGALIPRITNRMAQSRDAQRLSDIRTIKTAVDQYFIDKGTYPAPHQNSAFGGWDVSQDGDFIPELFAAGYLKSVPHDPLNDDTYQYRYYANGQDWHNDWQADAYAPNEHGSDTRSSAPKPKP